MTRRIPLLIACAVLALSACTRQEEVTARQDADDSMTIRLALLPVADCLPFYYAAHEGLFDSVGVKVRLKTYRAAAKRCTGLLFKPGDKALQHIEQ